MKAYKLEILVLDFDEVGDGIKSIIEDARYPNHCISPDVMSVQEVDIGPWSDNHPLNKRDQREAEFKRLFSPCQP